MGLVAGIKKFMGGYPGGWKAYARGATPIESRPWVQPTDPDDRRSGIPPLGLREYWYPAVPAKDVGGKKPVGLRLLGTDVVLFRDAQGEVQALMDVCPHRGSALSWGDCFWQGTVSCPYHGATFDGAGECVAFVTEGPDSKMVGRLKVRKFPTRTLKGLVFVWMGDAAPAPIEEDVPPEFFEGEESVVLHAVRYWHCNWMVALENTADAHNCFWVHRDSLYFLHNRYGGRPRTPLGYKTQIVNDRAAILVGRDDTRAYYQQDGKVPYQMHYPGVNGQWPLHRWRLLWCWAYELWDRRNVNKPRFQVPDEWAMGMHLPSQQRIYSGSGGPGSMYTRVCVPVEENLTRVYYYRSRRIPTRPGRFVERLAFKLYRNFISHYNFSDQDYDAMRTVRYDVPEYLSSTDSSLITQRRLIAQHARGLQHGVAVKSETTPERLVAEGHDLLGVHLTFGQNGAIWQKDESRQPVTSAPERGGAPPTAE
jgi:phenylpropionate dioxygenase-like ring-hydroxylating dioxygenase large terminal subunit